MPADMKGIIAETFGQLVRQKGMDKVTVKALIEACHISRQTFYYHFQDIMDVLEWTVRQTTRQLVEQSLRAPDLHTALQEFISFSVDQFSMLHKLMDSRRRPQVEEIMLGSVQTYLRGLAQRQTRDVPINPGDQEILLKYSAGGLVAVLLSVCGQQGLNQERLARQLEKILAGEIAGWLPTK